jgi:hypothetical protein
MHDSHEGACGFALDVVSSINFCESLRVTNQLLGLIGEFRIIFPTIETIVYSIGSNEQHGGRLERATLSHGERSLDCCAPSFV